MTKKVALSPATLLSDRAPCDFFVFPKMKLKPRGKRFNVVLEIQQNLQQVLNSIMKETVPASHPLTGLSVLTSKRSILKGT
jgi:hypothetical protein